MIIYSCVAEQPIILTLQSPNPYTNIKLFLRDIFPVVIMMVVAFNL